MVEKGAQPGKFFITELTIVFLLALVATFVLVQLVVSDEPFATNSAGERFYPLMFSHVNVKVRFICKSLVANFTGVGLLSCMRSLMFLQLVEYFESLVAMFAIVGFRLAVSFGGIDFLNVQEIHVLCERICIIKGPEARGMRANVGRFNEFVV